MQQKEFRAQKKGQSVKELAQQARTHIKEQRFDDALDVYEQILKQNPEAAAAYMGMGNVHLRRGRLDEAENYFKGALHVSKKMAPPLTLLATVAQKQGDTDKALTLFQEALTDDSKFLKAALGMGKLLFQAGRYEEAKQAVGSALKYNPDAGEAGVLMSRILQKLGQTKQAIETLDGLLDRDLNPGGLVFSRPGCICRKSGMMQPLRPPKKSGSEPGFHPCPGLPGSGLDRCRAAFQGRGYSYPGGG